MLRAAARSGEPICPTRCRAARRLPEVLRSSSGSIAASAGGGSPIPLEPIARNASKCTYSKTLAVSKTSPGRLEIERDFETGFTLDLSNATGVVAALRWSGTRVLSHDDGCCVRMGSEHPGSSPRFDVDRWRRDAQPLSAGVSESRSAVKGARSRRCLVWSVRWSRPTFRVWLRRSRQVSTRS